MNRVFLPSGLSYAPENTVVLLKPSPDGEPNRVMEFVPRPLGVINMVVYADTREIECRPALGDLSLSLCVVDDERKREPIVVINRSETGGSVRLILDGPVYDDENTGPTERARAIALRQTSDLKPGERVSLGRDMATAAAWAVKVPGRVDVDDTEQSAA